MFCLGPLPCSEHQTDRMQRKNILVPFGIALSLQLSMWPITFNAQCPTSIWKIMIAILMDSVFNHFMKKKKCLNCKRHQWEECLTLALLVRHKDSYKAALGVCPAPGSNTKSFRLSELCGAPEVGENPMEEWEFQEASEICTLGLEAAATRRSTTRPWRWQRMTSMQTSLWGSECI